MNKFLQLYINIIYNLINFINISPLKYPIYNKDAEVCLITKDPQSEYKEMLKEQGITRINKVYFNILLLFNFFFFFIILLIF